MKNKFIYVVALILFLIPMIFITSCQEKIDRNVTWPEWASRPVITHAQFTSADGKSTVTAGDKVRFDAKVTEEFCDLKSYTLSIKYGGHVVFEKNGNISGTESKITEEFEIPFAPYLEDGGYIPEVTLSVTNVKNGIVSQRLSNDSNLKVLRPESPQKLYIVDDRGNSFEIVKDPKSFLYKSAEGADFSKLGETFHIAASMNGTEPDFNGLVWGGADGRLAITHENSPYQVPSTEGYGFKSLAFDIYTFELDKTVNYVIELNKDTMPQEEQGGVTYLVKTNVRLITDCEFKFEGFGDLKSMLQPDRFVITGEKTAKFIGHSTNWSIFFDTADNWLIVDYAVNNTSDQIWVTGIKACFPLGNDDTENEFKYLDGDGKVRFATLAAIKDDDTNYHIMVYLKDGFHIQLFRWMAWGSVVGLETSTPALAGVTDDRNYLIQGPDFKPGVYLMRFNVIRMEDKTSGAGAQMSVSIEPVKL